MKTKKFIATIGKIEGYQGNNKTEIKTTSEMAESIQVVALNIYSNSGIYISTTIKESLTVYNTEWGCPTGGEPSIEISGVCNPKFTDVALYEENVINFITALKFLFNQSSISIEFIDIDMIYID